MRFGVVGDPVAHSLSPVMHAAGYDYAGIDAVYERFQIEGGAFGSIISLLKDGSVDGVNVTMPHKRNAFAASDVMDKRVERLGAVNTMIVTDDQLCGFNTDIEGVLHALVRLGLPPDTPVHVLGAGGAAAAAIIATDGSRTISLSARDEERAATTLRRLGSEAAVVAWGECPHGTIVVNATPIGMRGEDLPPGIVESAAGLIDMPYGSVETPSVRRARGEGIPYADGLVMLAGQAAEAFQIFTGKRVPADVMESAARSL